MSSCRLGRAVSILVSFCIYSVNSSERGFLGSRRIKRNVVADGHKPQAPVTSPIKTVSISRVRKYARYGQTPPRDGGILKRVHRAGAKTSWVRARALHPASSVGHAWSCCCGSPPVAAVVHHLAYTSNLAILNWSSVFSTYISASGGIWYPWAYTCFETETDAIFRVDDFMISFLQ